MIIKAIMELLKALILFIIGIFPALPEITFLDGFVKGIRALIGSIDAFVSVSVLSSCLLLILLFYNARALWSLVMWVVRKIPGVS